jgi:hypothetical protein
VFFSRYPPVRGDRRFDLRAVARPQLAADDQRAVFLGATVAAEDVFALLEGQREAAREAFGQVLLLAADRFAVEDLELPHLGAGGVFDLEGDRAGRSLAPCGSQPASVTLNDI